MLCNVTGTLYLPNGQLGKSLTLRFRRVDQRVTAEYLGAVVPNDVYTQSDKSGAVDFDILTGVYVMHVEGGYSVRAVIPDATTADIADCIDAAAIPDQPPVWYQQALNARDEAVSAASDAEQAAQDAADNSVVALNRADQAILDAADAQSTADLAVSYGNVQELNGSQAQRARENIGVDWLVNRGTYVKPYPGGDLDDMSNSLPWGWFYFQAATMTGGPAGVSWGHVLRSQRAGGGGVVQMMVVESPNHRGGEVYARTRVGSAGWTDWQRGYNYGNILGTVSQSGGTPTGAIIERGSNANGEFVKYADGTMICTNSNSPITTNPAAFVGTPTSLDGAKAKIGRWF